MHSLKHNAIVRISRLGQRLIVSAFSYGSPVYLLSNFILLCLFFTFPAENPSLHISVNGQNATESINILAGSTLETCCSSNNLLPGSRLQIEVREKEFTAYEVTETSHQMSTNCTGTEFSFVVSVLTTSIWCKQTLEKPSQETLTTTVDIVPHGNMLHIFIY